MDAQVITVKGPDGQTFSFPLDTPPDEMSMALDSHYSQPAKNDERSTLDMFRNSVAKPGITEAVVQGSTLGFSDEVGAAGRVTGDFIADLIGLDGESKSYRNHLSDKRDEYSEFEKENPKTALGGQILGGTITGATTIGPIAAGGKTIASRIARGAAVGGGEGAVAGAGYSDANPIDQPVEFAKDVSVGGGVGTAIGGGLPAVGSALRAGFNKVMEKASKRGVERTALEKVIQAVSRDDMTVEEAIKRIDDMGPGATLADAGENTKGLLETIVSRPGKAAKLADDVLHDRADTQFGRIMAKFDEVIGDTGQSVVIPETSGSFTSALKIRVPITTTLKKYMDRPTMRAAWSRARKLASEQDQSIPPLERVLKDDFKEVETTVLHWLKKGLDDVLEPKRDQITGMVQQTFGKNQLRAAKETRRLFRDEVKRLNPSYAKQLEITGQSFQIDDAFEKGASVLRLRNERQVANQLKRMSPAELNAYRRGTIQAIEDKAAQRAELGQDVSTMILRHGRKLRVIFGDKADDIIKTLKNEREFNLTKNRALGNSRTSYRMQAAADFDGGMHGAAMDAATGDLGQAFSRSTRAAVNAFARPSEKVSQRAAEILLTTDPSKRRAIMADLLRGEGLQEAFRRQGMALTGGTAGGALSAR